MTAYWVGAQVQSGDPISVTFYPPPPDLRRFFTTFYITRIALPEGQFVEDALQPEWANLRMFRGASPDAWIQGGDHLTGAHFAATGPSTRSINFKLASATMWGVGLLPLGWAQYVRLPATDHANLLVDGMTHPSFARFAPLARSLLQNPAPEPVELERIIAFFRSNLGEPLPDQNRIVAIHDALVDSQVGTVAQLVDRLGASQRTVERICRRDFGFSPKHLLRRQRFMRSLSQFMLDPSLRWIGALDSQYHDQAQFVREFHEFMGMTPREYANRPHPVLEKFIHERARVFGAPVQTMDTPRGTSLPDDGTEQSAA